jgi:hypothetical protein
MKSVLEESEKKRQESSELILEEMRKANEISQQVQKDTRDFQKGFLEFLRGAQI